MSLITTTFSQVSAVYHVHAFDVGFVLEVNGFDKSETPEWKTLKLVASDDAELQSLILEVNSLPKTQ